MRRSVWPRLPHHHHGQCRTWPEKRACSREFRARSADGSESGSQHRSAVADRQRACQQGRCLAARTSGSAPRAHPCRGRSRRQGGPCERSSATVEQPGGIAQGAVATALASVGAAQPRWQREATRPRAAASAGPTAWIDTLARPDGITLRPPARPTSVATAGRPARTPRPNPPVRTSRPVASPPAGPARWTRAGSRPAGASGPARPGASWADREPVVFFYWIVPKSRGFSVVIVEQAAEPLPPD